MLVGTLFDYNFAARTDFQKKKKSHCNSMSKVLFDLSMFFNIFFDFIQFEVKRLSSGQQKCSVCKASIDDLMIGLCLFQCEIKFF